MRLNLNTIIIFVNDLAMLEHFYVDLLNLSVVEKIEGEWLLIKAGSMHLGLHKRKQLPEHPKESKLKFYSNTKIVFDIEEDLTSLRADLISKGVSLKEVVTWENYAYWLCDGEDPEGNVFQIRQKKEY